MILLCLPSDIPVFASSTGLPTVKKHTSSSSPKRDTEQRCTDTRIHLDVASDAEPGNTYGRTLSLEWLSPLVSEKEAETRSSSRSRKKTNQTEPAACHVRHGLPTLVYAWRSSAFMPPYDDANPHFPPPCWRHRLVRIWIDVFFFFLSMINKKKNKKKS